MHHAISTLQNRSHRPVHIITQNMSSKLRHTDGSIFPIHVLGNGAIGLLYASALQHSYYQQKNSISEKNSKPVTLLMRSHHEHRLRKNPHFVAPVTILDAPRSREYSNSNRTALERDFDIPVELIGDLKNDNSPIKCILLCTKANDAINALSSVWKRVTRSPCGDRSFRQNVSTIIILSNGALAIRDAIYENFGKNSLDQSGIDIVLATTTHGAYKMDSDTRECHSRFRIMHAGEGSTFCTNAEFIDYCKSIGWDCFLLSDFEMTLMLWKKLAVNCVINPLTAIHGVKNGELLNGQFRYLGRSLDYVMNHILEEISAVAMIDIESQFSDCSPKSSGNCTNITLMKSASQHLSVPVLKNFVTNVMSKTEDNVSSMLQDVRSERVTEVRLLNGYVVDSGFNKYNVECPWNRHLCEAVEALHPISEM